MYGNQLLIIALTASGLALIIAIVSLVLAGKARIWRNYFRTEKQPENLEEIIAGITAKIKTLEDGQGQHQNQIEQIMDTLSYAVQYVGMVRFNSLADEGGNLSFALVLLDAHKSGTVITSLYGRQSNRIYTKRIIEGVGETNLSDEENDALFQALEAHH